MAIHKSHKTRVKIEPRRDPIDEPGKHTDRVPEVIDPPDPRRRDHPGPDSPRRPEDLPAQEVQDVPAF